MAYTQQEIQQLRTAVEAGEVKEDQLSEEGSLALAFSRGEIQADQLSDEGKTALGIGKTVEPNAFMQVATQAVQAALPSAQFDQPLAPASSNPVLGALQAAGQTLRDPTRLSSTLAQPAKVAGEKVEKNIGGISGKIAGTAVQMAGDPATYALGPVGTGVNKVSSGAAKLLGTKVAAPAAEALSGTRQKDLMRLFDRPLDVLGAPSLKKSGQEMSNAYKALGVTDEEMRLISKAGDRATGGSRSVVESLMEKAKKAKELKEFTKADYVPEGKPRAVWIGNQEFPGEKPMGMYDIVGNHPRFKSTVSYETLQKEGIPVAGRRADVQGIPAELDLTNGELIAGRRAASKLTAKGKGMEEHIAAKDVKAFASELEKRNPEVAAKLFKALDDQTMARTRQATMSPLPLNQNMSANALRGSAMGAEVVGGVMSGHPMLALTALSHSPLVSGVGTLAAKGAYKAAGAALGNPVSKRIAPSLTLAKIREYLQNQQTTPGSR
jgi:hypothetical protein